MPTTSVGMAPDTLDGIRSIAPELAFVHALAKLDRLASMGRSLASKFLKPRSVQLEEDGSLLRSAQSFQHHVAQLFKRT